MKVAFLGLGQMGTGVALRLLGNEHQLTVWNRSEKATKQLTAQGARAAGSTSTAVQDADVIFTMLTDDDADP